MYEQKPKLPRSVIVLNIIMIVIVLVICGLVVSLVYSDALMGEQTTTVSQDTDPVGSDNGSVSGSGTSSTTSVTTTQTTTSVSMTKRSTDESSTSASPTESESVSQPDDPVEQQSPTDYSREFFADDLFIGDSITTGLYLYNKLDWKNVAASRGYTPYKAYNDAIDMYDGTAMTALDYAKKLQPKRIFIMLGSNGLASASAMHSSYKELIDKLGSACPDSYIYCISVTPIAKGSTGAAYSGITNDDVIEFNSFIKGVCSEQGIRYLDFYSEVIDADGWFLDKYAEADGLHFKGVTYDRMLNFIQSSLDG